MDISGISTSLNTRSFAPTSTPTSTPGGDAKAVNRETQAPEAPREQARGVRGRRGLALGILKQELRSTLQAFFRARYDAVPGYSGSGGAPTSDDVAGDALGAAKQVVAEAPTSAARALVAFRAKVSETVSYVRETVGQSTDDIDDVVAKVDNGLDELDGEVANYRESSASVLAVDTRSKQRSTIQIRTQEGDLVRLSLKRVDRLSATDVAFTDGEMSATSTEVAVSSRSRMMMRVEGDLNDSEMTAIRNVFAQAEMIADEFFGGDIGAAFNIAQGFEFDTGQLARVNLRFQMREVTNIRYAQSVASAPAVVAPETPAVTAPIMPAVAAPEVPAAAVPAAPAADAEPATRAAAAEAQPSLAEPAVARQALGGDALVPNIFSALADFLDALSAFLQTVGEGFEAEASSTSFTYHYSESFKLKLLHAVVHTIAPDDAEGAAANAGAVIDAVSEADKSD